MGNFSMRKMKITFIAVEEGHKKPQHSFEADVECAFSNGLFRVRGGLPKEHGDENLQFTGTGIKLGQAIVSWMQSAMAHPSYKPAHLK
ncbi:MAG: hypothetical protein ABL899_01590 [Nitrospira sp.]